MVDKFFTDEELVAYLDDESDFAPVDEIEAALKSDVALAKRLDQLNVDKDSLATGFASIAPKKKFEPATELLPANQNRIFSWRAIAASVFICLGVGFGASTIMHNMSQPGWKEYVAAYQALYTSSTLSSVKQTEEALTEELVRVSAAIGKSISPDQLRVSDEIEYKRSQILGFEGTALIQLAFLTSMGEPMALCILRTGADDSGAVNIDTMEGLSSANWSRGGYSFLLIGGKDQEFISRLADKYILARL